MNKAEYQDTQDRLLAACLQMMGLPLEEFVKAIDRASAVGPIVDPTLYRTAGEGMEKIREVAVAAQWLVHFLANDSALTLMATKALAKLAEQIEAARQTA